MAPRRRREKDDGVPIRTRNQRGGNASALPWILAILGAVVLFCGGTGAVVFFVAIGPKLDMARRVKRDNEKQEAEGKVTKTKLNQLRAGMTKSQVEAVMGQGMLAGNFDITGGTGNFHNMDEMEPRWQAARERKLVYFWREYTDRILVAYSHDPNAGGTVVGLIGSIDQSKTYAEPVRLPSLPR